MEAIAGNWHPSLIFVLGGAVAVSAAGYLLVARLKRPAFDTRFDVPTNRRVDAPLIAGSTLFGIGWGLAGFCPGPAMAALSTGAEPVLIFAAAMLAGMALHDAVFAARPQKGARESRMGTHTTNCDVECFPLSE
ncbi:YeeE/YedE family protein [Methylobacterium sp. Leaf88]|uniref:YeeE/YedE family protein n=1 Tax=Methylobacterium sp. Leaf88 TaxID=1736244 RepID=UPI000AF47A2C|nr:YeeE/YedE family protein [Methylobacterium sp. Leaf88]